MRNHWKLIGLSILGCLASANSARAQNPETLPTLPDAYNYAIDVNNKGEILGIAYGKSGGVRGLRWVNGELQSLDGFPNTYGLALNDAGVIVGAGYDDPELGQTPVVWVGGKATPLPTLGFGGIAYDINANGDIVGWVNSETQTVPAIWRGGKLTILASLRGMGGEARSIDADGLVSGFSNSLEGDQIPTQWKLDQPAPLPVTFGQNYIGVLGVNRTGMGRTAGYVVQRETAPGVGDYLISVAVAWQDGEFRVLQRPGDQGNSYAADVTSQGIYVGSTTSEEGYPTPTLWDNDGGARLPIDFGRSARAAGANDTGLVVGVDVTDPRNPVPVLWRLDSFPRLRMGNFQAAAGQTVSMDAVVTRAGRPVVRQKVTYQANGVTLGVVTTDAKGVAKISYKVPSSQSQPVRIMASLGGSNYIFRKIEIGKSVVTAAVSPSTAVRAKPVVLAASLRNHDRNTPLANREVTFFMRGRAVAKSKTDAQGRARVTITTPSSLPFGVWPIEARYAGDATTRSITARATVAIVK